MAHTVKRLGDVLLEDGLVTEEQVSSAVAEQKRSGRRLGKVLLDLGFITESILVAALARQIGLDFVELGDQSIDPTAASLVPENVCIRYGAIPISFEGDVLVVAMSDPANVVAADDIRSVSRREIKIVVATRADVLNALSHMNRMDGSVESVLGGVDEVEDAKDIAQDGQTADDAPVVKLVNLLVTQAVNDRASDIHIEPEEKSVRVRYRVDGVLHEVMRPPKSVQPGLISRIKIMADINIAEKRIPQDGRIGLVVGGKSIDLRVATLPTVYGEKVVLRILDKSSILMKLSDLGFSEDNYKRFEVSYRKPYGMILVTGPTGSGKSTTLYATLNIVNTLDRNIITVEDPVEYRLAGVNQVQVNNKAGLSFASALRSILRSDPDVVLIGEIRDRETAQIAVEASLTGHLVLSTLHTNDAASAVTRLTEMGIEPFLVSSAIDCVLAQRLIRVLCKKCKEPYTPTKEALIEAKFDLEGEEPLPTLYRHVGCPACAKTGFRGRSSVHEVMIMSEEIERLTAERRSAEEVKRVAVEQGMSTLRQDGMLKVREGVTSLDEILRVIV